MAEELSYSSPSSGNTTKVHPSPMWALPCVAGDPQSLDNSWHKEDGKLDEFLSDELEEVPNIPNKNPQNPSQGKLSYPKKSWTTSRRSLRTCYPVTPIKFQPHVMIKRCIPLNSLYLLLVYLQLPRAAAARAGQEAEDRRPLEWAAAMRLIQ